MATSPNYAWAEPDNSSLVKNGASDIRTLGDAIDTSVWNVGFGQGGKNKIINGNFGVNQRSFTSNTADNVTMYDRFTARVAGDGTATYTAQVFTPGAAPVAGYESTNYLRIVTAGQSTTGVRTIIRQTVEDVRVFAGQTVTLSFWAKAGTGTPKISALMYQNFGSGGSASVDNLLGAVTISTSWARYSLTIALPSISGKTVGTGSALGVDIAFSAGSSFPSYSGIGVQNNTFEIWGIQAEYGSKATPFQLAGGGQPQAELALCQRYYYRQTAVTGSSSNFSGMAFGFNTSATNAVFYVKTPVTMRTVPTSVDYSTLCTSDIAAANFTVTALAFSGASSTTDTIVIETTVASGQTQYRPAVLRANNSTTAYLGFNAEL
jgi:hypothetical protein